MYRITNLLDTPLNMTLRLVSGERMAVALLKCGATAEADIPDATAISLARHGAAHFEKIEAPSAADTRKRATPRRRAVRNNQQES